MVILSLKGLLLVLGDVKAMVLRRHGDLMLPLSRYATVNGIPIT
ncbi:Malate dehydrogenase [Nodularia spumigena CCY9414]|nr:Malate dehydrogenase [Nodularia spumigena CCY9414]